MSKFIVLTGRSGTRRRINVDDISMYIDEGAGSVLCYRSDGFEAPETYHQESAAQIDDLIRLVGGEVRGF